METTNISVLLLQVLDSFYETIEFMSLTKINRKNLFMGAYPIFLHFSQMKLIKRMSLKFY